MNTKVEPLVYRIPVVNSAFFGACVYVCGVGGWVGVVSPVSLLLLLLSRHAYIKTPPSKDTCLSTLGLHFMEQKPLPSFMGDGLDLVLFFTKNKTNKTQGLGTRPQMGTGTMETRYSIHVPMECGSKVNHRKRPQNFPGEEEIAAS